MFECFGSALFLPAVRRFGTFSTCCFAWLGYESGCCSSVSEALRQGLSKLEILVFLARSVGDVSAVFRAAVSHGLGTYSLGINPAAVPLFRKRFSKSFLFRMVWASILLAFLRVP